MPIHITITTAKYGICQRTLVREGANSLHLHGFPVQEAFLIKYVNFSFSLTVLLTNSRSTNTAIPRCLTRANVAQVPLHPDICARDLVNQETKKQIHETSAKQKRN